MWSSIKYIKPTEKNSTSKIVCATQKCRVEWNKNRNAYHLLERKWFFCHVFQCSCHILYQLVVYVAWNYWSLIFTTKILPVTNVTYWNSPLGCDGTLGDTALKFWNNHTYLQIFIIEKSFFGDYIQGNNSVFPAALRFYCWEEKMP